MHQDIEEDLWQQRQEWLARLKASELDVMWVPNSQRRYVVVSEEVLGTIDRNEEWFEVEHAACRVDLETGEKFYRVYLPPALSNLH